MRPKTNPCASIGSLLIKFAAVVVLAVSLCSLTYSPAFASTVTKSGTCGDAAKWTLYDNGQLKITGSGDMYDYAAETYLPWASYLNDITSIYIGPKITSVGARSFTSCSYASKVTFAQGSKLKKIGSYAFQDTSITSVTIPASVKEIGDNPFVSCYSLKSIKVASGNKNFCVSGGLLLNKAKTRVIACPGARSSAVIPASVTTIGRNAFCGCEYLTSITIPSKVSSIVGNPFAGCSSLTSIKVAKGNSHYCISNGLLVNSSKTEIVSCPGAKTKVTIPKTVTTIGEDAFRRCSSLLSVAFPSGCKLKSIGPSAFNACEKLRSITLPSTVTTMGTYAFAGCKSLASVVIPPKISTIAYGLFVNCSSLRTVNIPSKVKSIDTYAFAGCTALSEVRFAAKSQLETISTAAFYGCWNLDQVTITARLYAGAFPSTTKVIYQYQ